MSLIRHLLELIRFSHTLFALPFALLAALLAWRDTPFEWRHLAGLLLCMVFARSAAMAFNRLVDRDIDASNPRTEGRHLPAGKLSVAVVRAFTLVCCAGFIAGAALFLPNRWPLYLAVPVLLFLLGYSYAKRWTSYCHYWLSAALMLSPIAAWIAIRGTVEWPPVLLGVAIFFWVGGFDILYACQDVDFDRRAGLNSLPARLGIARALRWAMVSHLLTVIALVALWQVARLGPVFLAGVLVVAALLVYEHRLVRPDDLSRVNTAFFRVNALISVGLLVAGAIDLWATTFSKPTQEPVGQVFYQPWDATDGPQSLASSGR
jgi:4-hydroxybenzoate polyprenyltransferase